MIPAPVVAALFVARRGAYWTDHRCDAWDEARDARNYRGPLPVVAHPPCGRWCKLAPAVAARYPHMPIGVDGGCFASALQSVRNWGGVLEHPAQSAAWAEYDMQRPSFGSWQPAGLYEWVTEVWQVDYGHLAQKKTWLYYVGAFAPPRLRWLRRPHSKVVGFSSNRCHRPSNERLGGHASSATPSHFKDELIRLALHAIGD